MSNERSSPFLLPPGATRVPDAMLPFKASAADTGGAMSVCEFSLQAWESGPVLHSHDAEDEGFFVVAGTLEVALGDARHEAEAGTFIWVPRTTAHTFANAGATPLHVLALAMPGGIESMFAEHAAHIRESGGAPDPQVMDEIGTRHGARTLGPPIRSANAPAS